MTDHNPNVSERFSYGDTVTVILNHGLPSLYFRSVDRTPPAHAHILRCFDDYVKAGQNTEGGAFGTFPNSDNCGVDRGVEAYVEANRPAPVTLEPATGTTATHTPATVPARWPCGTTIMVGDVFTCAAAITHTVDTLEPHTHNRGHRITATDGGNYLTSSGVQAERSFVSRAATNPTPAMTAASLSATMTTPANEGVARTLASALRSPSHADITGEIDLSHLANDATRIVIDALIENLSREMLRQWREMFPGCSDAMQINPARKYTKISRGGSVLAFVDRLTGDVFMAASWRAPARHARGNVLSPTRGFEALDGGRVRYLR